MNTILLIQSISKFLSRLSENVKILNSIGDYSLNIYAENALIEVFNLIYDANFKNINSEKKNYPSIDLVDSSRGIAIQITSTNNNTKIKDCISKFFKYGSESNCDTLYIFILTEKQKKYDDSKIKIHIKKCINEFSLKSNRKFKFTSSRNIIDKIDIIQTLYKTNNINQLSLIELALKNQFEKIEAKEDLSKYYQNLKKRYYEVVMNDAKGMTLKDIYVEPDFKAHEYCILNQSVLKLENNTSRDFFYKNTEFHSIHSYFNSHFFNNVNNSLFKTSNIALILGYPGQGKTSFCIKLVYDHLTSESGNKDIFYFKLKDIRDSKNLINNPLSLLYEEACFLTEKEINKHTFRKSVLVLDGLDELFMKEGLRLDDIERLCRELIRETEKFNSLQIIITSRYGYIELEKLKKEDILIFQLDSFDEKHQNEWVEKYQRFHPDSWLTLSQISSYKKKRYIRELIEQPLLLHILASLSTPVDKYTDRTALYDRLFTDLIERRYSQDGQIENLKNIEKEDLREIIEEIAFAIYKSGNGYISKKELMNLSSVKSYLEKLGNLEFRESIKGIMISFYFKESEKDILENGNDKDFAIEFLHKSLQEFMVAEKLVRSFSFEFINKDMKGKYVINSFHDALKLINELFSLQPISREIEGYLMQMIAKIDNKDNIAQRVNIFFNDLVAKDFLYSFDSNKEEDPILRSLYSFNGTWLFLRLLSPEFNYLSNIKTRQKVVDYLKTLGNSFSSFRFDDLSFQDLTRIDATLFGRVGGVINHNINFSYSDLNDSQFIGSDIINCKFSHTEMFCTRFYECLIKNCDFSESYLGDCVFENVTFENVNFSNSSISILSMKNVNFRKMKQEYFYGVKINLELLISIIKLNVKIKVSMLDRVYDNKNSKNIEHTDLIKILKKNIPNFKES
ncbi:peptide deformylase [Sporocytophaga myxococcoides]|uniref:Peptide deformylase n=1 Tax=Sporocytophaga myxococcoides TaxID=153721 RepID=A0A098LHX3_9BACT|nr:SMEK domain-containing protein [Sporocytophaga myxococcoides]GAL86027.1 peptide deformylase [Sporocytophaga myxococcoides]